MLSRLYPPNLLSINLDERPDWDTYFMRLAVMASTRATCKRAKVGVVFVRDHVVLATGYNGAPSGHQHCITHECDLVESIVEGEKVVNCKRSVHAEPNGIALAARRGVSLASSSAYITHYPCYECVKLLVQAGVERVFYWFSYRPDPRAERMLGNMLSVRQVAPYAPLPEEPIEADRQA